MLDSSTPAVRQNHAVIWIDREEARVFHINGAQQKQVIHPGRAAQHARSPGGEDRGYMDAIAAAVADAAKILVVGPGATKSMFIQHLQANDPQTATRVIGIETSDHPPDGQLLAHARARFQASGHTKP